MWTIFLCFWTISLFIFMEFANSMSSNCFYLPNIALNEGTYNEFTAPEIKHCCIACARDPCCIAYTYDREKTRCYMKSAISASSKHSSMTSGLKANTHQGQGAFLRNIKIQGGTASAVVNLPNTQDCMQYCTAYGIYSWSPLPPIAITTTTQNPKMPLSSELFEEDEFQSDHRPHTVQYQLQGQCSCMSRISSIEYSFGSRSAIFPPVSNLN